MYIQIYIYIFIIYQHKGFIPNPMPHPLRPGAIPLFPRTMGLLGPGGVRGAWGGGRPHRNRPPPLAPPWGLGPSVGPGEHGLGEGELDMEVYIYIHTPEHIMDYRTDRQI